MWDLWVGQDGMSLCLFVQVVCLVCVGSVPISVCVQVVQLLLVHFLHVLWLHAHVVDTLRAHAFRHLVGPVVHVMVQ